VCRLVHLKYSKAWPALFALAALVLVSLPVLQVWLMDKGFHGRWLDVPAASFQLRAATGEQVALEQFAGRYVYLYFGYLRCDGYCQAQMVTLFLLGQQLADKPVSVVFVTLDPERDKPEELRAAIDNLAMPNFYALLPKSLTEAQALANTYQSRAMREGDWRAADYKIAHSGEIFLIAPDGNIKLVYAGEHLRADEMSDDFERLTVKKEERL